MSSSFESVVELRGKGHLWWPLGDGRVTCAACGQRCIIAGGAAGVCGVRSNVGGTLRVPWGYVAAAQVEPVEKKPFFHFFPGEAAFTFGLLGCDMHCGYCQNWVTSQVRRVDVSVRTVPVEAPALARHAKDASARIVAASYNEPLVSLEWSIEVFRHARTCGLKTAMVSDGNVTEEAVAFLQPWVDAYKVDLKAFSAGRYRELGGDLGRIVRGIELLHSAGIWLEVVTLLVPGFNDDPGELRALAEFLASTSRDIPWHVTAYHRDYRMRSYRDATPADLVAACEIGRQAGLRYVYAGNHAGRVGPFENTYCATCGGELVQRHGYGTLTNRIDASGACPDCGLRVPGFWLDASEPSTAVTTVVR